MRRRSGDTDMRVCGRTPHHRHLLSFAPTTPTPTFVTTSIVNRALMELRGATTGESQHSKAPARCLPRSYCCDEAFDHKNAVFHAGDGWVGRHQEVRRELDTEVRQLADLRQIREKRAREDLESLRIKGEKEAREGQQGGGLLCATPFGTCLPPQLHGWTHACWLVGCGGWTHACAVRRERAQGFRWEADAPSCTHTLHPHAAQLPLPALTVHALLAQRTAAVLADGCGGCGGAGVDVVGISQTLGLVGAIGGGLAARNRKKETESLNEKLRSVNAVRTRYPPIPAWHTQTNPIYTAQESRAAASIMVAHTPMRQEGLRFSAKHL